MDFVMLFVIFMCVVSLNGEEIIDCGTSRYYNRVKGECSACSECIGNSIIRRVCEGELDTICGPFLEFSQFQQSPIDNVRNKNDTILEVDESDRYTSGSTNVGSPLPVVENEDKKWYTLAMALLGVISFLAAFVAIYIVAVCFVCRKTRNEKEIIYDPEQRLPLNNRTLLIGHAPSRRTDYETENSGQTISSTSSHYVYFQSAEPPN